MLWTIQEMSLQWNFENAARALQFLHLHAALWRYRKRIASRSSSRTKMKTDTPQSYPQVFHRVMQNERVLPRNA